MKLCENGVLYESEIYFYSVTPQAKKTFFYPLCTGHYLCDANYTVSRPNYNSYLIMYIKSGSGFIRYNNQDIPVNAGNFVFLDCYKSHTYFTKTGWETYWLHFDGPVCQNYFEMATQNSIIFTPKDDYIIARNLYNIYDIFNNHTKINEATVSKQITDLLTKLILCKEQLPANSTSCSTHSQSAIEDTLTYISTNSDKNITLDELAKRASFSPYYFTRLFKKETGYTPHEYIILARINMAKYLLKATEFTIKEIAFRCGYTNECNFCTAFKKLTKISPSDYRKEI